MLKRIVAFALYQPLFLLLITALFIAGGLAAFRSVPIEAYPDVGDIQATVITLYPGHAANEVEKQVTTPVEIALSGLPHAVRIFSHTQFGLSYVVVTFDDRIDDYFARQQVNERLQGIDGLPAGLQPSLAPMSTAIGEIYRYRLSGPSLNATEARSLQDWVVARRLKMCPGVADVVSLGGLIKQYEVNIDQRKLDAYGLSLQQVMTALNRGSTNAGGGYIEQGSQQFVVRGLGLLRSAAEIGDVVVDARKGTALLVKDIAAITIGSVPRQGIVGQDGDDEAVTGVVLMRKGENPSAVLANIKERIAILNRSVLTGGAAVVPFYDRQVLVNTTLGTVFENLFTGAALVAGVLWLFLGNLRAATIVALIIPLALLATFIGLQVRGISANLLSLGAMDFGIIVDGAVIVMENVFRRLAEAQHRRGHPGDADQRRATILEAAIQVGRPTLFSMLIIITAYVPIFALQRHEGRIFAPMAYTIISALIGSLVFSLTLVPLLAQWGLRGPLTEGDNFLVRASKGLYRPVLGWALRFPKTVLAAAFAALLLTMATLPWLGTEFLPELNEGSIWLNINLPPSISLSETKKACAHIRSIVRGFPEVTTVISKAGRPEDGTDPKMVNMTETFVGLKPKEQWPAGMTRERLIADMGKALDALPGMDVSFSQPIRDNVLESISQIDGQIVIKLFGDDVKVLNEKSQEILALISKIRGVATSVIDRAGEVPQLEISIDRTRASRYGLNVADVEDVIEANLGGKVVTELWEGDRRFDVAVRLPERERNNLDQVRAITVQTPAGSRVPLSDVADLAVASGKVNISHEDGQRVSAISVFIKGRDMGSLVAEMRATVASRVSLPPGYTITWGGEFENQERAMRRLAIIVPISIFMIFLLLFNTFASVRSALLILANIPLALIGGILALLATGTPLSVSAAIGFIALMGQAVLNGVVLVSYFEDLLTGGLSRVAAVVEGSLVRLRTVLMTTLLAMLGLLPMALSSGIGSEVQKPLAIVVIGGLVSALGLTLIVLPILWLALGERGFLRKGLADRGQDPPGTQSGGPECDSTATDVPAVDSTPPHRVAP
jgi:cobalt-zinc-cadmium resistance protein CzcA